MMKALTLDEILIRADEMRVTDIHITVGTFPAVRRINKLVFLEEFGRLDQDDTMRLISEILDDDRMRRLKEVGEVDLSFSRQGLGRYRVNAFRQRGTYAMAIRTQPFEIPEFSSLNLPHSIRSFTELQSGLVLVTGATGSGKSTTLASLVDIINQRYSKHIITVEDPIEYLHKHKSSIVNQREIGLDSYSFADALRAALREDPDVILVGEMRDYETTSIALTAAETGHLVFSTMHTNGAAKTIDRILDMFPGNHQNQVKSQLASVIQGVVTQQLIPRQDGTGMTVACEVLVANSAVRNLVREGKPHQINSVIQTGAAQNMQSMNSELIRLYREGVISRQEAVSRSNDRQHIQTLLKGSMY